MIRRFVYILIFTAVFLGSGFLSPVWAAHETTVSDIIRMARAGLTDQTIMTFLRVLKVQITLTPKDISTLAEAGVEESLINALIELMGAPSPVVQEVPSIPAEPEKEQYPVNFYRSSYSTPWFNPRWFYHDLFFGLSSNPHHIGGIHGIVHHNPVLQPSLGHGLLDHPVELGHGVGGHHGEVPFHHERNPTIRQHLSVGHSIFPSSLTHRSGHQSKNHIRLHSNQRGHRTHRTTVRGHVGRSHGRGHFLRSHFGGRHGGVHFGGHGHH